VAVVREVPVEPDMNFAAARQTAQSRKPHAIIIAVRIGFSLGSVMLPCAVNRRRRENSMRGSVEFTYRPLKAMSSAK
jgi:hypothetical protein